MELKKLLLVITLLNPVLSMNIINFINEPKDTVIQKDGVEKIICSVNQVTVKYSWIIYNEHSRSEQPIVQNQYISLDGSGILIMKHHSSVVGRYRCKAIIANMGTVVSRLFRIDVADMYINKMPPKQLGSGQYQIGSRALLICPFWTVPQSEAEYRWFVKIPRGRKQILCSETTFLFQNGKLLELKVQSLSFGTYYCEILYDKNGLERTSPEIEISPVDTNHDASQADQLMWIAKPIESILLERNEFYSRNLRLTMAGNTIINREGTSKLELICSANFGDKEVMITWHKDGTPIDQITSHIDRFKFNIVGQGTLVLINTTKQYSGEYICKAASMNGEKKIQTSVKLDVRPQLRFAIKPAPIVTGDVNKEILLSCRLTDTNSRTGISWRKNGELILSNSYLLQSDGFMRISRLLDSDEGIFQCLADDEFFSLQAIVRMKINKAQSRAIADNRPLQVENLRVRAVSYRTLNISWNHAVEGFETILHYEITLFDLSNLSPGQPKIFLKADRLESSVLVKNLLPDSFHRIFVSSVNGSGTSYPAIINSSPRVLSMAPSAAPTKVLVLDIGSGVATIRWTPVPREKMNGELLRYRVLVSSLDGLYVNSIDVDKTLQTFQLSGLTPDTKYSVRIQALTRGGSGPLSDIVTFDTNRSNNEHDTNFRPTRIHRLNKSDAKLSKNELNLLLPGEISNWRAKGLNKSIALQWSHPTSGGNIKKYRIKWGKVYPGPNDAIVQYPSNSYVIDNLEYKTQYMVKIIPVNDVGEGKELLFSQYTENVDLKKIPIPLNLGVKSIGMDSVIISWEDPSNDVSNTRIYQVTYYIIDKATTTGNMEKNTTESNVQITGLRPSTNYGFSVRTGDIASSKDGDYGTRVWTWSEWSLKETFSTVGEKPTTSPQNFALTTIGLPDVRENDVYSKVMVTWSRPDTVANHVYDEIVDYIVFFTSNPSQDQDNWHTQILPSTQTSSEVSLSGREKVYYFRMGCKTKNYHCPLSKLILYKTANAIGKNYGVLWIPKEYQFSVVIPSKYLMANPIVPNESTTSSESPMLSRDLLWIIVGIVFGTLAFLMVLLITICICCRRRSKSPFNGYKLGTKSSNQRVGGAGLLSNQSPAISNGKVSPHFVPGYTQQLKTPDLFAHSEPHFGDLESDSNQDNDSLRFASVSQHHLASATTCANMFNPTIQNHSLMRSHPQMSYYPDMAPHTKSSINSTSVMNPLININSISIPSQVVSDSSLQRLQHQNNMYPFSSHPFTQHLINAGSPMPICSSSCMQPIHLSPHMLATQSHDVQSSTNYSNTPRVNASELASHTSSEDIRPLMQCSRVSDSDVSQYYGSAANSTVKSHHTSKVDQGSSKRHNPSSEVVKKTAQDSDVTKGFSTEELSQEMANLEGLMKDLNAITQKEFEC